MSIGGCLLQCEEERRSHIATQITTTNHALLPCLLLHVETTEATWGLAFCTVSPIFHIWGAAYVIWHPKGGKGHIRLDRTNHDSRGTLSLYSAPFLVFSNPWNGPNASTRPCILASNHLFCLVWFGLFRATCASPPKCIPPGSQIKQNNCFRK